MLIKSYDKRFSFKQILLFFNSDIKYVQNWDSWIQRKTFISRTIRKRSFNVKRKPRQNPSHFTQVKSVKIHFASSSVKNIQVCNRRKHDNREFYLCSTKIHVVKANRRTLPLFAGHFADAECKNIRFVLKVSWRRWFFIHDIHSSRRQREFLNLYL